MRYYPDELARLLPPRVAATLAALVIALLVNAIHKNILSGIIAVVALVALGAWLGDVLTHGPRPKDH